MPSEGVDTAALASYLSRELGVTVTDTAVLHDGLNLSLAISTAEEARAYVLRRPNELRDTEGFIDVTREYEVLRRLRGGPIPVPEPVLVCEDDSVIGDPFLLSTYLDGEAVPLGEDLPERFRHPAARRTAADLLVDALADLHSMDPGAFAGVCERRTPRDQVAESADRLAAATRVTGHDPLGIWDVAEWLRRNAPSESETTLCHGDFRPGNVLFAGTDAPELSGVLDWETAFLGDPLTELGYLLLRWRDDGDPTPTSDAFEARYSADVLRELRGPDAPGVAPFTDDPASPSRGELVARYEDQTGRSFEHERFYRALAAFVLAAVWADLDRHQVAAGGEPTRESRVDYLSLVADGIAGGEFEL